MSTKENQLTKEIQWEQQLLFSALIAYTLPSIHPSNIIHPSTPHYIFSSIYLYLYSTPEQNMYIYIYNNTQRDENMNEHSWKEERTEKKFTKIVLLMFGIMALSLHTHHQCRRRWWNIDDDRNNDFDDDTTMAIHSFSFSFACSCSISSCYRILKF